MKVLMNKGEFYVDEDEFTDSIKDAAFFTSKKEIQKLMRSFKDVQDWFVVEVDDIVSTELIKRNILKQNLKSEIELHNNSIKTLNDQIHDRDEEVARLKAFSPNVQEPTPREKFLEDAYDEEEQEHLIEDSTNPVEDFIDEYLQDDEEWYY